MRKVGRADLVAALNYKSNQVEFEAMGPSIFQD
jgi:hypothetical protein